MPSRLRLKLRRATGSGAVRLEDGRTPERHQSSTGVKPANMSLASASVLSGTHSHTAKNLSHIARTFGFLCAASIASCDFHSETSTTVPSRERMIVGARSVTRFSLRKVGTRLRTRATRSLSLPGFGRYATMTTTPLIDYAADASSLGARR